MGALGELLDSFGRPFSARNHSNSFQIVLPQPICVRISATLIFSGRETLRQHVKDRLGKKNGELKKLPSKMRLNIYPDGRLWINIQTYFALHVREYSAVGGKLKKCNATYV